VNGGYLNFYIKDDALIHTTIKIILDKQQSYGMLERKKHSVILEHTSANPNGPFHVGRARNPIIGDTLTRIFRAAGYDCNSQFYLDDLGKQVAILTWGLAHINEKELPTVRYEKPDHYAVRFYQEAYNQMKDNKQVEQEINELIQKSEACDPLILDAIHNAYDPVLKGMKQSLSRLNITIDSYVPESTFVKDSSVEEIIASLKKSSYCGQEDGAYYLDLKEFGVKGRSTKFFFTRKDGTSLYATRDIAYHLWKANHADILINILGEDHKLEAKQVEVGLTLLNTPHLPQAVFYSFVSLPGGKMSTRRGRVVYLDDLIEESVDRAYNEVKKRREHELTETKMKEIAEIIGIGAIRYNIIKVQPEKHIVFKWEEALSFEGNSAPFIQYAHARAAGILTKTGGVFLDKTFSSYDLLTHPSERQLGKQLALFPEIIQDACKTCRPHLLCTYVYELASLFNQFYRDCPVLPEKNTELKQARLHLVTATKITLSKGLEILGISAPDEM
jgi:arginyl-tRNA synthetase